MSDDSDKNKNTYDTLKIIRDALEFSDYVKEKDPNIYEQF